MLFNANEGTDEDGGSMKRPMLSLFLAVLILVSVGGVVSIVGMASASHVTLGQTSTPTVKTDVNFIGCTFIGDKSTHEYKYPWCPSVQYIKPGNKVCFATVCDACAAGYRPCPGCHPPGCEHCCK